MKVLKKYEISIAQLENKAYTFSFEGDTAFFQQMEMNTINDGAFSAEIDLKKSETMLNLTFEIKGNLKLVCDRSLEEFDFPFTTNENIILKFGDRDEELADGIRIINRSHKQINVGQDLYELISLTIPMKKLHPRFSTVDETDNEGFVVYSTKSEEKEEITEDPRWAILKKLNNN